MFGQKKLIVVVEALAGAEMKATELEERRRSTLLRNEYICGNEEIVARVLDLATPVTYRKDTRIIAQGEQDDCVYFITTGTAEVRINNRKIDQRGAPSSVGEMAAKRAGAPRTADVVVNSECLEALALSGTEFRRLMNKYPDFAARLHDSIDTLSREKITQLGAKSDGAQGNWPMTSGLVASVSTLVVASASWFLGLHLNYIVLGSAFIGLMTFLSMLLLNPALRYRNLSAAAGFSTIALVTYGSLSFALTINGKESELPLIDFSIGTEQKLAAVAVGGVILVLLTWVTGVLDLRLGQSQRER